MKSYAVLIANPTSGRATSYKIKRAVALFEEEGFRVELSLTSRRGDAGRIASQAIKKEPSLIIASGGDGTFNEVANALAGSATPMAIIPMGTTNVLAKEINLREFVKGAVRDTLYGDVHTVSLGKIQWKDKSRYFLVMAGVGFDAETVYRARLSPLMDITGKGAHIVSGMRVLMNWRPEPLSVTADGEPYECVSLIASNGAKYAGHFRAAPDARMEDPSLYMLLMHGRRKKDIARYVFSMLREKHLGLPDVTYRKVQTIEVHSEARIQADGDYLGLTPATITVEPEALRLIY